MIAGMSWVFVGATVALTVFGQLVVKWRAVDAGALPAGLGAKAEFLLRLVLDPWVLAALLAAFVAALCWMAAMTRLELSRAYPFVGLTFVFVLLGGGLFFDESVTLQKVAGVALIVVGITIGAR
jgi:multidrug transporter EmrE-like cation transporter